MAAPTQRGFFHQTELGGRDGADCGSNTTDSHSCC